MRLLQLLFIFLFVSFASFSQKNTPDAKLLRHSIFFVGDIGESAIVESNLKMLEAQIKPLDDKGTLVFLGNSISENYNESLLSEDEKLKKVLDLAKSFKGKLVFLPGEKEWFQKRKNSWESLLNMETDIEDYLEKGDVFLPNGGCPGPVEIELSKDIVLLVVDSQWWLQAGEKPQIECGFDTPSDFLLLLNDALKRNKGKKIIFASHHPMYSAGKHGGNFPFPDPIAIYRKFIGTPQDFAYPFYKQMRYMAKKLLTKQENVISVAAHDNSLQYLQKENSHFIVSGSGSTSDYVSQRKMDIALREIGFSRLNFYSNNEVWLEFWSVGEFGTDEPHLAFQKKLYTHKVEKDKEEENLQEINYADSTITMAASKQYQTSNKFHLRMIGKNYRADWSEPINVPVFDIGKEKGGLKIVKRGGGQQTRSLRLEAKDGKQYVLRSVEKYTEKAIPKALQGTFAAEIVQDGISQSYPYAALTVPKMAEAVGVYHTNPKIVYLPDDPRLGIYRDVFKNDLYLFEERPKGDVSDLDFFGNSKKVISTDKLIKKRFKNSDLQIDEEAVLRARLFDIYLGDWDRHDDQWRWATFKGDDKTIVRPIPRDRDQVFFFGDGVLPWVIKRKWAMPKFQSFDTITENVNGLGFNARYFDRNFLQSKNREDWRKMALEIQSKLSDEVIESAVKDLPQEVFKISGETLIRKLKARREVLVQMADEFYLFLSKQVDVVGTNAREDFDAKWDEQGNLRVKYNRISKKGNKKEKLYERTFLADETKEVRIYGLAGKDKFTVKGDRKKGVKLIVVGGTGKDKVKLKDTKRSGLSIFDKPKTSIKGDGKFTNRLSKNKNVNSYDRKSFKYDVLSPNANLNFIADDGLVLGLGFILKKHGFRKEPYSALHKFIVNYAFANPSLEIKYNGQFMNITRGLDFIFDAKYNAPNFQGYYFGMGNETVRPKGEDKNYNRIRVGQLYINPQVRKRLNQHHSISFGAFYQDLKLKATHDRFVTDFSNPMNDLDPTVDFKDRNYVGINAGYTWDTRDSKVLPKRGLYWNTSWAFYRGLRKDDHNFQKMQSDLRLYFSLGRPQRSIFAYRIGAAHNTDGFSFYQANKLGLKTNLRGYRPDRFAGKDMVYQNLDFRFRLLRFRSYYLAGEMGILFFDDIGRVWVENEGSNDWHHGYGTGFWISPFKLMVITTNFSRSKEDNIFSFSFKYQF